MRFFCALVVCLLALSPSISKADFVIAVTAGGNSYVAPGTPGSIATAVAGQAVTLSVWLYDNADGPPADRAIRGYTLGFDVGKAVVTSGSTVNDGVGVAPGLSISTVTTNAAAGLSNSAFTVTTDMTAIKAENFDLGVSSVNSIPKIIDISPLRLFDVVLTTSSVMDDGLYNFRFNADATIEGAIGSEPYNNADFANGTAVLVALGGQFRITAVPEPSSLALVGLVSVGMCLARRRRAGV